jgi:hypothetical protein
MAAPASAATLHTATNTFSEGICPLLSTPGAIFQSFIKPLNRCSIRESLGGLGTFSGSVAFFSSPGEDGTLAPALANRVSIETFGY